MAKPTILPSLDGLLRGADFKPRFAILTIIGLGGLYGVAMGSYGGDDGPRALQMLFSALKVPILIGVTSLLSLPSIFVVSSLFGLRDDFALSLRALMATQGVLAITLASFAPFTLLWYASSANYNAALLFNGLMFGLASLVAQRVLKKHYAPLIARDPRHKQMLRVWLITYAFVGIQMAWVLRPFVGNPDDPTTFFRGEAWGNAYEVIVQNLRTVFSGGL